MRTMMPLRVLITGGAGFIGSHVAARLLEHGHRVRIVDDLSTGRRENVPSTAEFFEASVTDPSIWPEALHEVDRVVHLAAIASVERSVEDPLATHDVNLRATIGLADAAAARDVRRFVYASSAAVYGAVERERHREDDEVAPETPYAIDKHAGELYLRFFLRSRGLDPRILRFFNVYGPRQDPSSPYSGVISIFANRLLAGRPLTVYGDGLQTRDFVYVGDVADIVTAQVEEEGTDAPSLMNVGTERRTSLRDLIDTLEGLVDSAAEVRYAEPRAGDLRHSASSCERLREWRGSAAETELRDGLAATVAWLRSEPPTGD